LLYLAVSGATIPTQRAFAMTAIVLVAIVIDRLAITLRLVSVVAVGLLLVSPDVLLNVSFQMSFGAVVALVAFYEKMRGTRWLTGRRQSWLRSVAVYAAGVCMTSLIAGFATGFIAAFHFNRYANWGLAANLVAVPIMALWIMPAAILTFLLLPFGLESYGLTLMTIGIELVLLSAHTVAGWDYAVLLVPAMPMSAFVATMVGALWLCLWSQNWRYWGIVMIGLGMWVGIATRQPDILVNAKGTLFAVQDHKNAIVVSSKKAGRRARETWLRRNGQKSAGKWSDLDDGLLVQCDSLSCVYRPPDRPDLKVAMVKSTAALPEDCQRADIVISAVPTRYWCPETKLVIDRFDLWRAGAHAIWIESDEIIVETVAGHRGRRPWNAQPPKNR
jgi:competence protein ComEC